MKPAAFDYFAPESLDEAVALLGRHGERAKVLAVAIRELDDLELHEELVQRALPAHQRERPRDSAGEEARPEGG